MLEISNTWRGWKETCNYNKIITKKLQLSIEPMTPPRFPDVHDVGIKPVISRRPQRVWRLVGLTRRHVSHLLQAHLFILPLTPRPLLSSRDPQVERTRSRDAHIMQSLTTATCNMLLLYAGQSGGPLRLYNKRHG
jgi:hypothetical protein